VPKNDKHLPNRQSRLARDPVQSPKRPWYADPAILIALTTAVVTAIAILPSFKTTFFDPEPIEVNVQLVADLSAAVAAEAKPALLQAVQLALRETSPADNLALRRIGGDCQDNGTLLVVPFATSNQKRIAENLIDQSFNGRRALTDSILQATGDFNDSRRFGGKKNRIVILTTGEEECLEKWGSVDAALSALKQRVIETGLRADIILVGFGLSDASQNKLSEIALAVKGRFRSTNSPQELKSLLASAIQAGSVSGTTIPMQRPVLSDRSKLETSGAASAPERPATNPSSSLAPAAASTEVPSTSPGPEAAVAAPTTAQRFKGINVEISDIAQEIKRNLWQVPGRFQRNSVPCGRDERLALEEVASLAKNQDQYARVVLSQVSVHSLIDLSTSAWSIVDEYNSVWINRNPQELTKYSYVERRRADLFQQRALVAICMLSFQPTSEAYAYVAVIRESLSYFESYGRPGQSMALPGMLYEVLGNLQEAAKHYKAASDAGVRDARLDWARVSLLLDPSDQVALDILKREPRPYERRDFLEEMRWRSKLTK
jgi:hypothetical protein